MRKRMLIVYCVSFVALALPGCVGLVVQTPEECKNETPYTAVHNIWEGELRPPRSATKDEFLHKWGKPDEIISSPENMETWIYTRKLWCGVIPVFFLPVPLMLPACDGFDRIEFKDNKAMRLHTRHSVAAGLVIGFGGWGGTDPVCRFPLPTVPGFPKGDKIPDNAGLVFVYNSGSFLGGKYPYHIVENGGISITPIYGGSFYPFLSLIGEKEFRLGNSSQGSVILNVKSGQTYYIKIVEKAFKGSYLSIVDNEIGEKEIDGLFLISSP